MRFSEASSVTPAQSAGSSPSGVRPSSTKRALHCLAHSTMHPAARYPRAPPETTMTSPALIAETDGRTARGTLCGVKRPPAAGNRHFDLAAAARESSPAMASATAASSRVPRSTSIDFNVARGHSSAAVLTSAGRPAEPGAAGVGFTRCTEVTAGILYGHEERVVDTGQLLRDDKCLAVDCDGLGLVLHATQAAQVDAAPGIIGQHLDSARLNAVAAQRGREGGMSRPAAPKT
ncbi:hypothetical protein PEC18_05445 [Paucibacter sp. O1-1]|nr:hypothetical protein [Paucibacter sp. O1-1]MDA3825314.1 hypothetical protein [Paucibacter sp. O1-1]